MADALHKIPYAQNSGQTPEMKDTSVNEEQQQPTEGVNCHALQDNAGKVVIIKSPELDNIKSLIELASNGANDFFYRAELGRQRAISFGLCATLLYGVCAVQHYLLHTTDLLDFALGTTALGVCALEYARSKQCYQLSERFSEQEEKLSNNYNEKFIEISQKLQHDDNRIMFR